MTELDTIRTSLLDNVQFENIFIINIQNEDTYIFIQ